MPAFGLSLLGGFELRTGSGVTVRLPTRKAEALLAYLALTSQRGHGREALTALLWGDATDQGARASLRQTLSLLGKALGREALATEGRSVALAPDAVEIDVVEFERCSVEGGPAALARAAELYQGDLLAGLAISEPAFEDWLLAGRERLRERAIDALARLVAMRRDAGEMEHAIQTAIRLLALDPLLEGGHRALMRLYVQQGRRAAALRQYQVCVGVLKRELGAEPEAETRQLYNEILRQPQTGLDARLPFQQPAKTASAVASWPAEMPVHDSALIGRDTELASIVGLFDDVQSRHGRIVAILGETGIGKTRLTEELAAQAVDDGIRVLVGRCYESQQLFPFAPWVDMFRAADVPGDRELLDGLEPAWRSELARLLPELAIGRDKVDDEASSLARRDHLFEAIVQMVARLAARGPLVLVLEDLHWADEMSLRLLAKLGRRVRDWPVMLVLTAREEELPGVLHLRRALQELEQRERLSRLCLTPLSQPDTTALVRALARSGAEERSTARLADRIWQASEGNPFVVVESMRAIGADLARGAEATLALPERVRDLIKGHIERLSAGARALVAVAAVAGREIDFALLQHAAGQREQEASEALEELVRRQILRAVGEYFDFTHARVRQTVSDSLLEPMRRSLHGAIAEAIEALYAHDLAQVYDRLAYHYARTDRSEKAVYYQTRFAERAAHGGAHEAAIAALDEGLGHLARRPEVSGEHRRLDLVFRKARSLFFLGRFNEVMDLLLPEQAQVNAAADPRMAAAYHFRLGSTQTYLGEHAGAVENAKRALAEATSYSDRMTMGKAHFLLALESFWARPEEGVQHGRQAVTLLEDSGERWWLGQACWVLGLNLSYRGHFAEALEIEQRARMLGEATGDRRLASYAAWTTGFISTLAGDWDTAVSACRKSVELSLDPLNRMTALGMLALAHVERREPDAAIALLEEAIPQAERFRIPQLHGLFLSFRGEAMLQRGDAGAALELTARGAEITRAAGYIYGLGWSQRVLGRIARAAGDLAGARAHLGDAIRTFEGMGAPFEAGRTHLELSDALQAAGDTVGARPHAEAALAALEALGLERFMVRAHALLARLGAIPAAAK